MGLLPQDLIWGTNVRDTKNLCSLMLPGEPRLRAKKHASRKPSDRAGDQLHMQVFETPELEQHPRVTDARGSLMLVGNVRVAGLTPAEAATRIQQELIAGNFLNIHR